MPVRTARHSGAIGVRFMMTARAVQSGDAFSFWTTDHVGEVSVAIITLLGIVGSSMTVDTPRTSEHRIDLIPGGQTVSATCGGTLCVATMSEGSGDQNRCCECANEKRCKKQSSSMTQHTNLLKSRQANEGLMPRG